MRYWIPPLATLFVFLLSLAVFGPIAAKWVLGGMLLLFGVGYGLTGFLLTCSNGYLVISLLNICYGIFIWSLPLDGSNMLPVLARVMLVCMAFLMPALWIFFFTRRLKGRGREIFDFYGFRPVYTDLTWVPFSLDGTLSAHMAKKDYLDYR